jgi:predicted dehydrogenase
MEKVRIAVAGAGSIGIRHIEEIQRSQGAVLSAIIDPSPKAIEVGEREDAPVYRSLAEFLVGDRPDGVVLATPNQMHVEQGLQCIAADVPVLIEKPIAHTLEDGTRLVQAAERANARLLVGDTIAAIAVAVIRGSADPLVTARDGLQNLRVTDAILEAARTGATVKISAKEA